MKRKRNVEAVTVGDAHRHSPVAPARGLAEVAAEEIAAAQKHLDEQDELLARGLYATKPPTGKVAGLPVEPVEPNPVPLSVHKPE